MAGVALMRDIQMLFETGTASGLSDRQLLERFVGRRDAAADAAFEILVLRHGPMVLRVCTNVLRDQTDAQDAFQATFLVLVRRCRSIRRLESVGSWLYGVAYRVAARARREAARRRAAERRGGLRVVASSDSGDGGAPDLAEFGPIIQAEVQHLPEKYRAVVVLCYWQGLNQEQAAAQLGCPLGTVRSRLARARNLLHRRLTRRGLAPLAIALAAALDRTSIAASRLAPVPPQLVYATIRAAGQLAAGQATAQVTSAVAASLVQQMVWSMTMIKLSSVALGVVLVGLIGIGAGLAAQQARGSRSNAAVSPSQTKQAAPNNQVAQAQPKKRGESDRSKKNAEDTSSQKLFALTESTIFKILPDHSLVKKGQVVCLLDSAAFKDQLVNQQITKEAAKANYENARLDRETAEIAVVEYEQGIFPSQSTEAAGDVKIAEAELALAQDVLAASKPPTTPKLEIKRAELAVLRARVGFEKAQNRRELLSRYTKGKRIKTLKSTVEKTRSTELAKKATWELETSKERKLERQIAACTMVAPRDGRLRYVPAPFQETIHEGLRVSQRQLLFEVVPDRQANPKTP